MAQTFLPDMKPTKRERPYVCRLCHPGRPSVVWHKDLRQWVCWACGRVDAARTKRMKNHA